MGIERSLKLVGDFTSSIEKVDTETIVAQMSELIRIGGKLPVASALQKDVVARLSRDTARVEEIPAALCSDIIVPLRFLALSNQAFYSRGQAVTDLGTLGSLIGVTRVGEKFDELGSVAPLSNAFKGRALAMATYQNTILSALLSQRFFTCIEKQRFPTTLPFLTLIASELPLVLLSYTKPHLYAACYLDSCAQDNIPIERFMKKIFQVSMSELFSQIASSSGLPAPLSEYVEMLSMAPWNRRGWTIASNQENRAVVTSAFISQKLGALVPRGIERQDFFAAVRAFDGKADINKKILDNALVNVSSRFLESMIALGLPALRLARYLQVYEDQVVDEKGEVSDINIKWPPVTARLNPFVIEIKAALKASSLDDGVTRLPHVLASTALALMRGLSFDRVVLFVPETLDGGRALLPKLTLGRKIENESLLEKPLEQFDQYAPHVKAFKERQAIFQGDPLFDDDWPFVAFPLIQSGEVKAVLYADKKKEKDPPPISTEEQVALIALSEVFHDVPPLFS